MNDCTSNPGGIPVGALPDGEACCPVDGIDIAVLEDLAGSPLSMTEDGQTVTERSAADLIALDRHIIAKRSVCRSDGSGGWGSLGLVQAIHPSTQGN